MIYVIGESFAGPIKVGIAINPQARLGELNVGNHRPLTLFTAGIMFTTPSVYASPVKVPDAAGERRIHKMLKKLGCHLRGEWFNISVSDLLNMTSDDYHLRNDCYMIWSQVWLEDEDEYEDEPMPLLEDLI